MPTVLIVGTYDTKKPELDFLAQRVRESGADALLMDVSILDGADDEVDINRHKVAAAADKTIEQVAASGDENSAMELMAQGASSLARDHQASGKIDAMLALGGSMGTDLALDVARSLPLGVPKYVVSTIAFSPLIPAQRLAPDIQMILWAGGLYGLNEICRMALSQAAGAVVGASRAVQAQSHPKPLIGMTSLGKSCLSYMVDLKPALEERGYEVAVFHATGMGGRAFESLAAQGAFAAVFDFCPQEVGNHLHGSIVNAGADRMENAGRTGIPQLVAPGCMDLVDFPAWTPLPDKFSKHAYHAHNRLLGSIVLNADERRQCAQIIGKKLAQATGPVHVFLPLRGIEEWDKKGMPAHDPKALDAFADEMQKVIKPPAELTVLDAHINDEQLAAAALAVFDQWCEQGLIAAQASSAAD